MDLYGLVLVSAVFGLVIQYSSPRSRYGRLSAWTWLVSAVIIVGVRIILGGTDAALVVMAGVAVTSLCLCAYWDRKAQQNAEVPKSAYRLMLIGAVVGGVLSVGLFLMGWIDV